MHWLFLLNADGWLVCRNHHLLRAKPRRSKPPGVCCTARQRSPPGRDPSSFRIECVTIMRRRLDEPLMRPAGHGLR
jgi:hypothetical protein